MKAARSIAPPAPVNADASSTAKPAATAAEIQRYMPLVNQTVARFLRRLPPNVLRDDLIAAGTYGLVDSLRKNGSDRGPSFEWYARIRIRGAILDELRTQDWLTRRARCQATAQNASMSESTSASSRAAVIGFDDVPGNNGAMNFADESAQSPLQMVEEQMDRELMAVAVAKLPERERFIVQAHYYEGAQFKAIATKLGVSEPRVSQLHARAVQMLKTILESRAAENAA